MDPDALRSLLAENIRAFAAARGVTLTNLADFAGVSRAQLFAVLAKSTAPTTDWLAKVAEALEVELWRLLVPAGKRRG